ncbi:CobW family GTP-binding protein [Polaromonas naphthalenivorans]|uniref:Cobalamin synthesis protein, P47K n=1 Tax=Polaromonas naphthalenivorans (strain CJ2) TaxID=365044 RepID=A1VLE8_POLNA|nr:GTP-binding protein [Polaromonas naphthalenivorans]ABM36476.1 cobalamin synthesis protein, P47K [Polaromonas naphthalenivorans CJ2]
MPLPVLPGVNKAPVDRIPVTLLTGFLGGGKTTLLNHWVHQPEMAGVAVLINEFGEIGIDHHLVDTVNDQMLLLESGCLCCSISGDLVAALKTLFARSARREIAPITRVVIETTGLADPVPVLYTLMEDPFVRARYVCDAVVTVISATHGLTQLRDFTEARRQVVMADRLLLSKCDQATTPELERLENELRTFNPHATQVRVRHGIADPGVLTGAGIYGKTDRPLSLGSWFGIEEEAGAVGEGRYLKHARAPRQRGVPVLHTQRVSSFVVTFEQAVPWYGFSVVMGQILRQHAAGLLRVKGLLRLQGEPRPQVIQCVQDLAYPPVHLTAWPTDSPFEDGRGRLVFIVRELEQAHIDAIRTALAHLPGDRAALRASATDWTLPTRCWLSRRVSVTAPDAVGHDAWVIQPRRFRAANSPNSRV